MKRFPRARLTLVAAATAAGLIGSLLVSTAAAAPARPTPASATDARPRPHPPRRRRPRRAGGPVSLRAAAPTAERGWRVGPPGRRPRRPAGPRAATPAPPPRPRAPRRSRSPSRSCTADTSSAAGAAERSSTPADRCGVVGTAAQPIPIDGGRTLWLFGDTYIGGGPYGGPLTTTGVVHNSMVVQYNGNCFAYLLGNNGVSWSSAIPEPNATDWYWPDDGTYDPSTGILSIVATHVRVTSGGPVGMGGAGCGRDALPRRADHHAARRRDRCSPTAAPTWPSSASRSWSTAGVTYLYGCAQSGTAACYLARTDLELRSAHVAVPHRHRAGPPPMPMPRPWRISALTGHRAARDPGAGAATWPPTRSRCCPPTTNGVVVAFAHRAVRGGGRACSTRAQPPLGPMPSNWFTYGGRLIQTSAGTIGVYSVNTWDAEASAGGRRVRAPLRGPQLPRLEPHPLRRHGRHHHHEVRRNRDDRGWAIDPDTTAAIQVRLTVDGVSSSSGHRLGLPSRRGRLLPRPVPCTASTPPWPSRPGCTRCAPTP